MAHGQPGTGEHRGRGVLAQEIVAPCPFKGRDGLPETVARPTVVTLGNIGAAEELVRQRLQEAIPTRLSECDGTLAGGDNLVVHAPVEEILCQLDTDLSQSMRIIEGHCEDFSLAQQRQDTLATLGVARRLERIAQSQPQIDGLLAHSAGLWQMW